LPTVYKIQGQNIIRKLTIQITKKAEGIINTIIIENKNKPYEGYGS
jgi:hypothetical protein